MCGSACAPRTDNRFWRKTLRDNDGNGTYGDNQDGVDPNRNYPTKRGIDEEGASNSFATATYRGPFPLSEPEDLASTGCCAGHAQRRSSTTTPRRSCC